MSDVTVNYYPKNDSLAGSGSNNNADGDGVIQLHPLTDTFTVGTGTQTPFVPSTTGGATYLTRDGTTAWTAAGGDYDAAYVNDSNATLPASKGTVPFTWDITSLLANGTTNGELSANGAILVLPDTISQVPLGTQDFTSLDSANNTSTTPFITVTLVPRTRDLLCAAGGRNGVPRRPPARATVGGGRPMMSAGLRCRLAVSAAAGVG